MKRHSERIPTQYNVMGMYNSIITNNIICVMPGARENYDVRRTDLIFF